MPHCWYVADSGRLWPSHPYQTQHGPGSQPSGRRGFPQWELLATNSGRGNARKSRTTIESLVGAMRRFPTHRGDPDPRGRCEGPPGGFMAHWSYRWRGYRHRCSWLGSRAPRFRGFQTRVPPLTRQLSRPHMIKNPDNLASGEMVGTQKSCFSSESVTPEVFLQRTHNVVISDALPDQGAPNRFPSFPVSNEGSLTLVGDTNTGNIVPCELSP